MYGYVNNILDDFSGSSLLVEYIRDTIIKGNKIMYVIGVLIHSLESSTCIVP